MSTDFKWKHCQKVYTKEIKLKAAQHWSTFLRQGQPHLQVARYRLSPRPPDGSVVQFFTLFHPTVFPRK